MVSRELDVVYLTVSLNEFKNKSSCDSLKYAHVKFAKPALLKQILLILYSPQIYSRQK